MKNSIVQVLLGRQITGAGFLVSADGLIVSCAHVVVNARAKPGDIVDIRFLIGDRELIYKAQVLVDGWRDPEGDDLAFLKLQGELPSGAIPLTLTSSRNISNHEFQSFGFPEIRDKLGTSPFEGVWANGKIIGIVKRRSGTDALQLSSHELDLGFSGSPILDKQTGQVVGIVSDTQGANPNKKQQLLAWGTPSESIVGAYPEIYIWPLMYPETTNITNKLKPQIMQPLMRAEYFSGRQNYLKALKKFWKDQETGVLSLVGIGGCGKTAIVRQFLEKERWLGDDVPKGGPDGVFVWSFYDNQDTTKFITDAYKYFSQGLNVVDEEKANVFKLADVLRRSNGKFLIVMDGLEKMQSMGSGPALPRGTIIEPALRHLLTRIVDGVCGNTKAIVTSRFQLSDLFEWIGNRYTELDVSDLDSAAARKLLLRLGVKGSRLSVDLLASEYGRHALTLDLLGRLLSEYYDGEISLLSELPVLEFAEGSAKVEKQAARLARVLRGYEKLLSQVELQVLEVLCVFRRPVDFYFLAELLCNKNLDIFSIDEAISTDRLKIHLHKLADRRLITVEKYGKNEFYTSHPAIRDHFYIRLTSPRDIHEIVRSQLATLTDVPGFIKPKDTHSIDVIEELVYHTIQTGKTNDAYKIYRGKLGYRHLGWDLGDHARGASMMRLFDEHNSGDVGDISSEQKELLTIDHGLYLKNLGLLDQSIDYLERITEKDDCSSIENKASAFQNLSAVQVLRGKIIDAERTALSATELAQRSTDERLLQDCRVRLGTAYALQGKNLEALNVFGEVKKILTKDRQKTFPRDLPGIRLGWLLMKLGRLVDAEQELLDTREMSEHFGFHIISARADIILAELAFRKGRVNEAINSLENVRSWASGAFDQEMVVAGNSLAAKIAFSFRDLNRSKYYLNDGLRVAEESGHSIYWIELKVLQGKMYILQNDWKSAKLCAQYALDGINARAGHPHLLGAQSPQCGYEWGKADAYVLMADVLINSNNITKGKEYLQDAINIQTKIGDPLVNETKRILGNLQ